MGLAIYYLSLSGWVWTGLFALAAGVWWLRRRGERRRGFDVIRPDEPKEDVPETTD